MTDTPDPAKSALLVMDYQPGIVERLGDAAAPLLARAQRALAVARDRGVHVGYVRVAFTAGEVDAIPATNKTFSQIKQAGDALAAENPATQVHPELAPAQTDIVVRKTRVGAFSTTDLHEQLTAKGVDTLILAGISTSGVVLSTVRDGADRDYRLVVLADACADFEPDVHALLTEKVFPRQAEVVDVGDLEALFG
ncbi:MAG TPA: cysteine hydrolase [Solirubrobacteraceae bacterium]|jgi:nicotinamidase-related amidase|nr:cysteine hydrolase [Solirubrobacteraceae bacterium]